MDVWECELVLENISLIDFFHLRTNISFCVCTIFRLWRWNRHVPSRTLESSDVGGRGGSGFIIGKSQSRKNESWGSKKGNCMLIICSWWLKGTWQLCLKETPCLPPDPAVSCREVALILWCIFSHSIRYCQLHYITSKSFSWKICCIYSVNGKRCWPFQDIVVQFQMCF